MSIRLIYHTHESSKGGVSPIHEAILSLVSRQRIGIVCPYLDVGYVKGIVQSTQSWCLLSDVEKWISSQADDERVRTLSFIGHNVERIRHSSDLHAKAIVTNDKAILGSANFTHRGLLQREELCVLFEATQQVVEINQWFNRLWTEAGRLDPVEVEDYYRALPPNDCDPQVPSIRITSRTRTISSQLSKGFVGDSAT